MNVDGTEGLRPWLLAEAAGNVNQGWKLQMLSGARQAIEMKNRARL